MIFFCEWQGIIWRRAKSNLNNIIKRIALKLFLISLALGSIGTVSAGASPTYFPPPIVLPTRLSDLDSWLAQKESAYPLRLREMAKTILWAIGKEQTKISLVYIHGFSATRFELSPVVEDIGREFKANVFFTRLTGHGMDGDQLAQVKLEDWLRDAEEAMAIGQRIANKVILIGMSTGAPLVTWLASRHPDVAGFILVSPNFGPKDIRFNLLYLPYGLQIGEWFVGKQHTSKALNEKHAQNWTLSYPNRSLVPMAQLIKMALKLDLRAINIPNLTVYTQNDDVICLSCIFRDFALLGSKPKTLVNLREATQHNLAGDILSPSTTPLLEDKIRAFLSSLNISR